MRCVCVYTCMCVRVREREREKNGILVSACVLSLMIFRLLILVCLET